MTNALRKAPQHTAVGFKQTVSGEGAGPPWAGSETPWGWDLTGLGCRTLWDVRPHGIWVGTSRVWEFPGLGPPGMSGPMEFGLGLPSFGTSWGQVWDFLGCQAPWSLVPWDLGLPRVRSRASQGWAPWGQFWHLPG